MTSLSDFITEHFHTPPVGTALICNRCGRDDIDAVTVHMENDHGIDAGDVDVAAVRRERCQLTTDYHGRRLPTDQLVENVLLSIFDRLFDISEGITVMSALSDAVASLEAKVDQALALLSQPNPDVQAAIDSLNAEGTKVDTAVAADTPAAPAPATPASPADTNAPAPSGNEIPAPVDPNAPSA